MLDKLSVVLKWVVEIETYIFSSFRWSISFRPNYYEYKFVRYVAGITRYRNISSYWNIMHARLWWSMRTALMSNSCTSTIAAALCLTPRSTPTTGFHLSCPVRIRACWNLWLIVLLPLRLWMLWSYIDGVEMWLDGRMSVPL